MELDTSVTSWSQTLILSGRIMFKDRKCGRWGGKGLPKRQNNDIVISNKISYNETVVFGCFDEQLSGFYHSSYHCTALR